MCRFKTSLCDRFSESMLSHLIDFRGVLPLLVGAACELALTLSQMRKFVVPKTSTVKVDVQQARVERVGVMAAKAGVALRIVYGQRPPT